MASRKEQKERLRRERLAREAEAAKTERRRRVLGLAAGGVLGAAALAAIVVAVVASGGDGGDQPKGPSGDTPKVPIPAQREADLRAAARAAGCTLRSFTPGPSDRNHVEGSVNYEQDPPVFGPHNEVPAHDGDYVGVEPPATEQVVHALEHGRVAIWYSPSLSTRRQQQLETLLAEPYNGQPEGYKQLLLQHDGMPFEVAASSWGQQLGCRRFGDTSFDALRAFRAAYVDKAPENVAYPE